VPLVSRLWPAAAKVVGEAPAEFLAPTSNGLKGDDNTTFSQEQLNIPQAEVEHMIQPDSMADDLGGKAMTVVRIGWRLHAASLLDLQWTRQAGYRDNARIALACASGEQNKDVAVRLKVHPMTVGKWRPRCLEQRVDGLCEFRLCRAGSELLTSGNTVAVLRTRGESWFATRDIVKAIRTDLIASPCARLS